VTTSSARHALILAPSGRDAEIAQGLLAEVAVEARTYGDLAVLVEALNDEALLVVLTDEALLSSDLKGLASWIAAQPTWSDLPIVVLTRQGVRPDRNPRAARLSDVLGDVSFLERPFHPTTFASIVRSALRSRLRQYEARSRMEELRESEENLRVALNAGHLGSWELDISSRTLTCDATCKAVFGRGPEDDFSYAQLLEAVHPDDRERMQTAVRDTVERGVDYAIEYRTIWPDHGEHWAEVWARRVLERSGRAGRLVGVSSDITERKMAEVRLRQLNETLEDRVAERTAELRQTHAAVLEEMEQRRRIEDQLRQAQKMEAVGQLTGGVAHDFNNLLMAVLANLQLLRKRLPSDPRLLHLADGAIQGAERGASLTQRLLAFARRQELSIGPIDLATLARGMMDLLGRSTGQSIRLDLNLQEDLPPANADANQLELALLNLVLNARDAMPDGGTISISLELREVREADELAPGEYLRLAVVDTGMGMDEATIQRAIDPFFSTKEPGRGTGLGLSMIHGLAVQLDGALRLTSKVGHGTTAELWLPAARGSVVQSEVMAAPGIPTQAQPPAKILAVDDDALILMSTVDMLEDLGHSVLSAHSGAKAMELLKHDAEIDLLITDLSMPGMNGAELARSARRLRRHLPVLLATGYGELPDRSDADFARLSKPYQQEQLAAEIARALQGRV
jgi:PAS domain S-box-containing protein